MTAGTRASAPVLDPASPIVVGAPQPREGRFDTPPKLRTMNVVARLLTPSALFVALVVLGSGCILDWERYRPVADAGPEPDADVVGDSDLDLDGDGEADAEPDADVVSDSDLDLDGDGDGEGDAETDAETDEDSGPPPPVFLEEGGLVVVEAEHFAEHVDGTTGHEWYLTDATTVPNVPPDPDESHAGSAANGAYVEALPDICYHETDVACIEDPFVREVGAGPTLSFRIEFTTPGLYYLLVRIYISTKDNTVYAWTDDLRADAVTVQMCGGPQWVWAREMRSATDGACVAPVPFAIDTRGEHRLHLSMREDGMEIDRLILTTDASFTVEGVGPEESPRRP